MNCSCIWIVIDNCDFVVLLCLICDLRLKWILKWSGVYNDGVDIGDVWVCKVDCEWGWRCVIVSGVFYFFIGLLLNCFDWIRVKDLSE